MSPVTLHEEITAPAEMISRNLFTMEDLKTLLTKGRSPCVSLYLPTHRGGKEADPILWKNLLREAEEKLLATGLRSTVVREFLTPARRLLDDSAFWKRQSDGLAFFLSPDVLRCYRLPLAFSASATVADQFQVKPLLVLFGGASGFYVLAISQNSVRLLKGTHFGVHDIELENVPKNLADALRFHDKDEPLMYHSRLTSGGTWGAICSGQGVGIDDHKDDLLRYFQQVDKGLHELLKEERAPLILAAVDYLWPIYHKANSYPHLLEKGIAGNPDRLSAKELHDKAWAVIQSHFEEARKKAAALFVQLAGTGRSSNDLKEIAKAAYEGRVEVLFLALDQQRWGTYDAAGGTVALHEQAAPGDEDLLNFAAVRTLLLGGTVYAVKTDEVPVKAPIAAQFWLPLAKRRK